MNRFIRQNLKVSEPNRHKTESLRTKLVIQLKFFLQFWINDILEYDFWMRHL